MWPQVFFCGVWAINLRGWVLKTGKANKVIFFSGFGRFSSVAWFFRIFHLLDHFAMEPQSSQMCRKLLPALGHCMAFCWWCFLPPELVPGFIKSVLYFNPSHWYADWTLVSDSPAVALKACCLNKTQLWFTCAMERASCFRAGRHLERTQLQKFAKNLVAHQACAYGGDRQRVRSKNLWSWWFSNPSFFNLPLAKPDQFTWCGR